VSAEKAAGKMGYFVMLTREEQAAAIRRMALAGMSDYTIAAATMLSADQIRAILGERANT
jgi:hypothetical protein